ncbi:MAG: PP2C family protein-serine/threonine phosphatase [Terriglobia bacterium]
MVPASVGFGVAFGLVLAWTGARVQKHVTERIDRAFFRSAYDARHILEDLAEKTRTVTSREALAALLDQHLSAAMNPKTLAVYLDAGDGRLRLQRGQAPPGLETLSPTLPALAELAQRAKPWEVPPAEARDPTDLPLVGMMHPECLVPILGREGQLTGLLVLGERLSEEPYSGEDQRLLASVAGQAGVALESLRLAEQMAERLEAARRVAHELEIATQVQRRLFPQRAPQLKSLELAGECIQARSVGGDYYDYLKLGHGRLGLALADIAGKGISAALVMSNLQAHLRSQYAAGVTDLERLLNSVNHMLLNATQPHHFATLFLANYDEASRRLLYANCGHNPPVLLRAQGAVERLPPTAMVLGLFEPLECSLAVAELAPGDTLVLFTDGVTEAMSDEGEEFGDPRLLATLDAHRQLPVEELLRGVIATVVEFSGSEQEDDLTLVVARAR